MIQMFETYIYTASLNADFFFMIDWQVQEVIAVLESAAIPDWNNKMKTWEQTHGHTKHEIYLPSTV